MLGGEDPMESEHLDNPMGAKTGGAVEKQNNVTVENKSNNSIIAANNGKTTSPHGGNEHNTTIDNRIVELKKDPLIENIRKHQVQVDFNGKRVGNNLPDIQYDKNGQHYTIEYDNIKRNSIKHGEVIKKNDPNANVELNILSPKKIN